MKWLLKYFPSSLQVFLLLFFWGLLFWFWFGLVFRPCRGGPLICSLMRTLVSERFHAFVKLSQLLGRSLRYLSMLQCSGLGLGVAKEGLYTAVHTRPVWGLPSISQPPLWGWGPVQSETPGARRRAQRNAIPDPGQDGWALPAGGRPGPLRVYGCRKRCLALW